MTPVRNTLDNLSGMMTVQEVRAIITTIHSMIGHARGNTLYETASKTMEVQYLKRMCEYVCITCHTCARSFNAFGAHKCTGKITSTCFNQKVHVDVADIGAMGKSLRVGLTRYILVIIEIFSGLIVLRAIEDKTPTAVLKEFHDAYVCI